MHRLFWVFLLVYVCVPSFLGNFMTKSWIEIAFFLAYYFHLTVKSENWKGKIVGKSEDLERQKR